MADIPENMIEGDAIVTTKDFAICVLDSVSYPDMIVITGKLNQKPIPLRQSFLSVRVALQADGRPLSVQV